MELEQSAGESPQPDRRSIDLDTVHAQTDANQTIKSRKPLESEKRAIRQATVLWIGADSTNTKSTNETLRTYLAKTHPELSGVPQTVANTTITAKRLLKDHQLPDKLKPKSFVSLYSSWSHNTKVLSIPGKLDFSDSRLQSAFREFEKFVGLRAVLAAGASSSSALPCFGQLGTSELEALHPDTPKKQAWRLEYFQLISETFTTEELAHATGLCMPGPDFRKEVDMLLEMGVPPPNLICVENAPKLKGSFQAQVAERGVNGYFGDIEEVVRVIPPISFGLFDFYGGFCPAHWRTLASLPLQKKALIGYNFLEGRERSDAQALLGMASETRMLTNFTVQAQRASSAARWGLVHSPQLKKEVESFSEQLDRLMSQAEASPVADSRRDAIDPLVLYVLGAYTPENSFIDVTCQESGYAERFMEYVRVISPLRMILWEVFDEFMSNNPRAKETLDNLVVLTLANGKEIRSAKRFEYQAMPLNKRYLSTFVEIHNNADYYASWAKVARPLIEAACASLFSDDSPTVRFLRGKRKTSDSKRAWHLRSGDRIELRVGKQNWTIKGKDFLAAVEKFPEHRKQYMKPSELPEHVLI